MGAEPLTGREQAWSVAESDLLTLTQTSTSEDVVVAIAGEFSACDVWFVGPGGWVGSAEGVTVRIFGLAAGGRVLLAQGPLADTQRSVNGQGDTSAWVFSVRGVPVEGFEVTCQRDSGGGDLVDGRFTLRAAATAQPVSIVGSGGVAAAAPVMVPGGVVVSQTQASSLQATVVQTTPSLLQATVVQPSASSLQATVAQPSAASLHATAAQGAPAAHASRWPVVLSDGAAAQGTTSNPLFTGRIRDESATFAAASGLVLTGTTVAMKSIAYLWHPSGNNKRVEVRRIGVSFGAGAGAGVVVFRALRITAVNVSPGGSALTPVALDGSDSTSLVLQSNATNAPSRAATADYFSVVAPGALADRHEWTLTPHGKPIVLRASVAEGIEVAADVKSGITTQMQVTAWFEWVEV